MKKNPLSEDLDYIISKTPNIWDELRNQKIFITGGTGFFGCWLLESFIRANETFNLKAQACILTRHPDNFKKKVPHLANNPAVMLYQGDICDFTYPESEFPFVIHAATDASATLNEQNPLVMFDTIVTGTRHCLEFARQAKSKKFLLTSSGAAYGRQPPNMPYISEEYSGAPDPMNPIGSYGEGKRCAELLCSIYSKYFGIETKIARCWAFVGPYLPIDKHFAIGNFIRDGIQGGPIKVNGDGAPYRSYQYAADLTVWLWKILFNAPSCRPYNIGSDQAISIGEAAKAVSYQCNTPVLFATKPDPHKAAERYVPSVKRAGVELNLFNDISFDEAIKNTIKWHKNQKK